MSAVLARSLHTDDVVLVGADEWPLTVAEAHEGDWTDHTGSHHGEIVTTRQLGPAYPLHFGLDQKVQVRR